jgi:uncharacterized protein
MLNRKALAWFLIITFAFSWPLFVIPHFLKSSGPLNTASLTETGFWAFAMWGPGLAAILTTTLVLKQPFRSLNLNRLGPKRMYLWAWFLPAGLTILGGLFALLFGVAKFDPQFTMMHNALASAPGAGTIPAGLVVALESLFAITLAPFINVLFALGEEIGWRGFLLPHLMPLGQWKAIFISGVIWGLWHAPAIVQGLNYPGYPVAGIFMMVVFCVLLATIFSWLYLNAKGPWISALAHGSVNAVAGLPILFFKPGFNIAFGGTLATFPAWIGMSIFIGWLVWSHRLPVKVQGEPQPVTV